MNQPGNCEAAREVEPVENGYLLVGTSLSESATAFRSHLHLNIVTDAETQTTKTSFREGAVYLPHKSTFLFPNASTRTFA